MIGNVKLNHDPQQSGFAASERRPGERSEPGRSGGAAKPSPAGPGATPNPEVLAKTKRRKFTAAYKLSILEQADRAAGSGEIGALLRREGLYSSHLVEWRRLRESGALSALSKKRGRKPSVDPLAEENRQLKADLVRLEKKLQQAEIIIDVQKKLSALLGIALPETGRQENKA